MSRPDELKSTESRPRKKRAARRSFSPLQPVLLVTKNGPATISPSDISTGRVGWKAFGISCLPSGWVPPFFVIESDAIRLSDNMLGQYITDCLEHLGPTADVIVRSSGTAETIEQRGRLDSKKCSRNAVLNTIQCLFGHLSPEDASCVHWLVEAYVEPISKGHLSNERRLTREPRDFVAEFETPDNQRAQVAVRHWRDGDSADTLPLGCSSQSGVTLILKRVALWATALPWRILFEWVWDGGKVWIVQADRAPAPRGVDPNSFRPTSIPLISPDYLQRFRIAGPGDFQRYRKLKNARMYGELGYHMPAFYILDDAALIEEILNGRIPSEIDHDLEQLTQRLLIIRTDSCVIPSEKREMLPRSDGLPTAAEAKSWLAGKFRQQVEITGIAHYPLCLIAHHFIPSTTAAWARAEPGKSLVRIESLWGLPEGLYWYSHDTFEVDVRDPAPPRVTAKKLRFKGTFIASDDAGHWSRYEAQEPFDWRPSVARKEWLAEIATTTKSVAEREEHAVNLMWFVGNDDRATQHHVLPWYHIESDIGSPKKAAPRKKFAAASEYKIETASDWADLVGAIDAGKHVERIILEPKDADLVRNPEFATQLARRAAGNNIVIELSGGILSHAYHILRRAGARVECVDLFGAEEEHVEYNKLVRDRIPDLIRRKGEQVEVVRLKGEALLEALRQKLVEEAFEAFDAKSWAEIAAELADVQEVISGILEAIQVTDAEIEAERAEKEKKRGGFHRGIMLTKTSTPHSLPAERGTMNSNSSALDSDDGVAIEDARDIPFSRPYTRPDARNVDQQREYLLTLETEINRGVNMERSTDFEMSIDRNESRNFKLTVKLIRDRSTIRSQIRVRLEPTQIPLKLDQLELPFQD